MKVLAFDQATETGWAVVEDGKLIDYGRITFKGTKYTGDNKRYNYDIMHRSRRCAQIKNFILNKIEEENPTVEELTLWIDRSGLPTSKFFNTSGLLYKENNMKDKVKTMSKEELIKSLSENGLMVKRPILLLGEKVLVGFKEEEWVELLLK